MNQTHSTTYQVHSEARGGHWVAWITAPGEQKAHESILLVGETQASAEEKAREWARRVEDQAARLGSSSSSASSK